MKLNKCILANSHIILAKSHHFGNLSLIWQILFMLANSHFGILSSFWHTLISLESSHQFGKFSSWQTFVILANCYLAEMSHGYEAILRHRAIAYIPFPKSPKFTKSAIFFFTTFVNIIFWFVWLIKFGLLSLSIWTK